MVKSKLFICCIVLLLLGCKKNPYDVPIDSPKIEVLKKLYSPDKTKLALVYKLQNSSSEKSSLNVSIIDSKDTLNNVYKNVLPTFEFVSVNSCDANHLERLRFEPLSWANEMKLIVEIDSRLFARAGFPFETKVISLYGIELEIHSKYTRVKNEPLINRFELSPDKTKLLVFYRNQGMKDENVSVINLNSSLPLYGNLYTSENPSYENYSEIEFGRWKGEVIQLAKQELSTYSLNKSLNSKIEIIKEFSKSDSLELSDFKNSVNSDKNLETILKNEGEITSGVITSIYIRDEKEKIIYTYEYRYVANGQGFLSKLVEKYRDMDEKKFDNGDTIPILFDRKQPIIHKPLTNYSN